MTYNTLGGILAPPASSWDDAFREVGRGFGQTYPGAGFSGNQRFQIGGFSLPRWLIRLDYIWHSPHWQPTAASIGPWDS